MPQAPARAPHPPRRRRRRARAAALLALACAALTALAPSPAAALATRDGQDAKPATASLVQCLPAPEQSERAATFAGEMSALAGAVRMQVRIELLERLPGAEAFHVVSAPGLDAWRSSDPGVQDFKYLKQVTNLSAPASYRALVRFRWLNAHGRLIKSLQLRTGVCELPGEGE